MLQNIAIPQQEIAAFCQRNHIRKLSLFGSVLRDDFRPDSDIDVLVEFEPEHIPGFFGLIKMQEALSEMLDQRQVDIVTPRFLNKRIHDQVLASAQVIYEKR